MLEVDAAFDEMSRLAGSGSQAARTALVADLFGRATAEEQAYLRGLVTGELRQGALDALVVEAVAAAAEVPLAAVRRAAMFAGATPPVAVAAMTDGVAGLESFGLEVGRPVRPMLASSAADVEEAFAKIGADRVAVDCKLDGIRIQVHKDGDEVRVFTRSLEEITDRVPEVVETARALPATRAVLDGEAIALDATGQAAAVPGDRRAHRQPARRGDAARAGAADDVLLRPAAPRRRGPGRPARRGAAGPAGATSPAAALVPRVVTADVDEARRVFADLVRAGHEGVVVKSLEAAYDAGRRGAAWVKVKPRHTLDLVVLAVEWGSGRRRGRLSNIHLGARDPETDGWVMLGKTFKGMTDEMLAWQTERFLALETSRDGHVVHVRPEQVVEIAFDGLQRSTRYPGGLALRFARVLRYRDDKAADEADTIEAVRDLYDV